MPEVVLARGGWLPRVVRDGDGDGARLSLELAAGADANHDPREFSVPIEEAHLAVLRDDLARHLLLWSALVRLADDAGTRGELDTTAARALLDALLLGSADEADRLLATTRFDRALLVSHGADPDLLERGEVVASLRRAHAEADHLRGQTRTADRQRAQRGVHLGPLDEAVLRFTGQHVHGATRPRRLPDAADPALLPDVLRVVATAEQASADLVVRPDPRRGRHASDKQEWNAMSDAVEAAVRRSFPDLVADTVRSVAFLMCSEAADRSRRAPASPPVVGPGAKTALVFTDDGEEAELRWHVGEARGAAPAFWDFVAEHASTTDEVFTLEDEAMAEGLQLHFYADSIARITTVESGLHVEYALVDGLAGLRAVVDDFVRGGCAALGPHGPWTADVEELERWRREGRT